jgi:hypothetical protein
MDGRVRPLFGEGEVNELLGRQGLDNDRGRDNGCD